MVVVDLIVKNGKIVTPENVVEGGIAIDDGKIISIATDQKLPDADKTVDAQGNVIFPGCIETHSHLGLYKPFDKDVLTETAAAACGGVTTNMTCVINDRPYKDVLPMLAKVCNDLSTIDVVLYAAMSEKHLSEIPYCISYGITGFKHFLNRPEYGKGGEIDFGAEYLDDGQVFESIEKIRDLGGIPMFHCENYELIRKIKERVMHSGPNRKDLAGWAEARPDFCEHEDMMQVTWYAKQTKSPIYIVHASHGGFTEIVDWTRRQGVEASFETCTSYLSLAVDEKEAKKVGVLGRVNPPIRYSNDREKLWQGIKEGYIHTIGSDHTPTTKKDKMGKGTIWTAGHAAMANTELLLPIMLNEGYHKRGVSLEKIAEVCSYNASQIFGIPNKGSLSIGYDGDLIIVDLKKMRKVSTDVLHGSTDFTPYEGWKMKGWPIMTISKGEVIVEDGQIIGKPGHGKHIRCNSRRARHQ